MPRRRRSATRHRDWRPAAPAARCRSSGRSRAYCPSTSTGCRSRANRGPWRHRIATAHSRPPLRGELQEQRAMIRLGHHPPTTPHTLGAERLATYVGRWSERPRFCPRPSIRSAAAPRGSRRAIRCGYDRMTDTVLPALLAAPVAGGEFADRPRALTRRSCGTEGSGDEAEKNAIAVVATYAASRFVDAVEFIHP